MIKPIAIGLLLSTLLAGCGGGGSSSAPPASPTATSVPRVVATAGDYYTFNFTHTPTGLAASNFSYTRAYPTVNPDGSGTRIDTYSNSNARRNFTYDTTFAATGFTVGSTASTTCTFTPSQLLIPLPATTSTNWNLNNTETCTGALPSSTTLNFSGSLMAFESVVTPAGTFYAGRAYFTETQARSGVFSQVITFSCWIDTVTGRTVKCNDSYTFTPNSGPVQTGTETFTLSGYSAAGLSSVPTVARFAGTWTGSYVGSSSGSCSSLVVSTTGTVTGSCTDVGVGAFTVGGTVNVAGTINMLASTGATFSGTLTSTAGGNGTWTGSSSGGGTWTASHQ